MGAEASQCPSLQQHVGLFIPEGSQPQSWLPVEVLELSKQPPLGPWISRDLPPRCGKHSQVLTSKDTCCLYQAFSGILEVDLSQHLLCTVFQKYKQGHLSIWGRFQNVPRGAVCSKFSPPVCGGLEIHGILGHSHEPSCTSHFLWHAEDRAERCGAGGGGRTREATPRIPWLLHSCIHGGQGPSRPGNLSC